MTSTPPLKNSSLSQRTHVDHLRAQREQVLRLRNYLTEFRKSDDPEILLMYQGLADLLDQAADEYEALVKKLQK